MQAPDELRLTFDQNPAIAEAFRDLKPGDKGELDLRFSFKSRDAEGVLLIVEAAVPEGYEIDESAEPETEPLADSGMPMTPAAMMVRRTQS